MLAAGLSALKRQSYDVRMPKPQARELAVITDHFNALARALETARTENQRLNRQLVTAQDDERRRTALELHDEVGPCLFGLKANASSIASVAAELPEKAKVGIVERLRDTVAIVDHLQAINRSMLERLRPMALGHVPLKPSLSINSCTITAAGILRSRFLHQRRRPSTQLWRLDRSDGLPLHAGKPNQCRPTRPGAKRQRRAQA